MAPRPLAQLPRDACRVIVRGTSGSGKTTLARRIADATGAPHVELDAIRHQAGWIELPDDEFRERVREVAAGDRWVTCGNYTVASPILEERADTMVLYDLPKRVVMSRVVRRSVRRVVRREELWNGNRERLRHLVSADPSVSVVGWAWTTHDRRHDEMQRLALEPPRPSIRTVLIGSTDDEALFRAGLPVPVPA